MTFPTTIKTIKIRSLGLSGIYAVNRPDGAVTVSTDKRSGAYTGGLLWTADATPTTGGRWTPFQSASAGAVDDTDLVVPPTATGVALNITLITGTPTEAALMVVKDASGSNANMSGGRHSSSSQSPVVSLLDTPVSAWYDFTNPATMFQDLAMTNPVDSNGQTIEAVADLGPYGYHLNAPRRADSVIAGKPTYITAGINGLSAVDYDRTTGTNTGECLRTSRADVVFGLLPCAYMFVGDFTYAGVGGDAAFPNGGVDWSCDLSGEADDTIDLRGGGGNNSLLTFVPGAGVPWAAYTYSFSIRDPNRFQPQVSNEPRVPRADYSITQFSGHGSEQRNFDNDDYWGAFQTQPNRLSIGGHNNGSGSACWHGKISEFAVWSEGFVPAEQAIKDYVLNKYAISWLL